MKNANYIKYIYKNQQKNDFIAEQSLNGEIWREIAGTKNLYYVSSKGRILSLYHKKPHILKPQTNGQYLYVRIQGRNMRINRLVAGAFLENPHNLPVVHHKDNNKLNNDISNLAYVSYSQNTIEWYKYKRQQENTEKQENSGK